jgi:hypothetical protein
VVRGLKRIAEVSAIMTHEIGAAAKVNMTDTIRPNEACALGEAVDLGKQAAIPRAMSITTLKPVPQM